MAPTGNVGRNEGAMRIDRRRGTALTVWVLAALLLLAGCTGGVPPDTTAGRWDQGIWGTARWAP